MFNLNRSILYLFMMGFLGAPGVQASSLSAEDLNMPGVKTQTSDDDQCYRIINGKRIPLFNSDGKLADQSEICGNPVQSVLVLFEAASNISTSAINADAQDNRTWIQKIQQPGNLISLPMECQIMILDWLTCAPVNKHRLLETCRYYRAFAIPILDETHGVVPNNLRKELLISILATQSADWNLFIQDQRETFLQLNTQELREAIQSYYYAGALSLKTEHGKMYRSVASKVECGISLNLRDNGLRLVPLNFPGAKRLNQLYINEKMLKIPPVVTHLTNLKRLSLICSHIKTPPSVMGLVNLKDLDLQGNQLETPPVVIGLTNLKLLNLQNNKLRSSPEVGELVNLSLLDLCGNQLTAAPVLRGLTNLETLHLGVNYLMDPPIVTGLIKLRELLLFGNILTTPPNVKGLMSLETLGLDESLCQNSSFLETMQNLNASRNRSSKCDLVAFTKSTNYGYDQDFIALD